ncbi:MAG: hypothetical protein ACK48H_04840 [Microcystis sp.]|uniref:hypothetical protein n=1 Tax=Microcystis sp. TaxID=1127 RepID=UPI00391B3A42
MIASPHPQKRSPLLIPKNDRHAPKIAPSQNDRLSSFPKRDRHAPKIAPSQNDRPS